jgi:hypothetical protein
MILKQKKLISIILASIVVLTGTTILIVMLTNKKPKPKHYKCEGGKCVQDSTGTQYPNDNTCNNECSKPTPSGPTPSGPTPSGPTPPIPPPPPKCDGPGASSDPMNCCEGLIDNLMAIKNAGYVGGSLPSCAHPFDKNDKCLKLGKNCNNECIITYGGDQKFICVNNKYKSGGVGVEKENWETYQNYIKQYLFPCNNSNSILRCCDAVKSADCF